MSTAEAWTVGRLLTWTAEYLKKTGSTSPRLDAEVLLAEARGCERIELYTAFAEEPSEEVRASFKEMVRRRAEGTPVAYLVGRKEFFSLPFEINPDVLIPRPETEHVVVEAVDRAKQLTGQSAGRQSMAAESKPQVAPDVSGDSQAIPAGGVTSDLARQESREGQGGPKPRSAGNFRGLRIADVGTGSGVIAIALAKSLPGAEIIAVDSSPAALNLAQRNIDRHAVSSQVQLLESDLLVGVPAGPLDLVVSNPPYISEDEYAALPTGVRNFEPRSALVGGADGTEIIQRLVTESTARLKSGGWLIVEISPMIAAKVVALFAPTQWHTPVVNKDLAGHARVVSAARR